MAVIRVGTDILRIERISQIIERQGERFARRILATAEQLEYSRQLSPSRFLAKRFAAKEAVGKALGTGIGQGVSWQDIEIHHDDWGAPLVTLTGRAMQVALESGGKEMLISISDEREYVLAFACLVAGDR